MSNHSAHTSKISAIAKTGLTAKGIVYCLLGVMAFMAAFNLNGKSADEADKAGVFSFVLEQTGGQIMLGIIAFGLLCYSTWRGIQSFSDRENKGTSTKGLAVRARYLFSGLVYASVALLATKLLFTGNKNSGDGNQGMAADLLSKPFGQWLVGIAAIIFIAVGIYQLFYGLSEKYKKHVDKSVDSKYMKKLLLAGKIGYVARGIVWLIIGWLFIKAALYSNSSHAGNSSKAFQFLSEASYGTYLLAALGAGLFCYGIFSFIRVKYEKF